MGWGFGGQGITFLVGANHLEKAAATMDATMQRISREASMSRRVEILNPPSAGLAPHRRLSQRAAIKGIMYDDLPLGRGEAVDPSLAPNQNLSFLFLKTFPKHAVPENAVFVLLKIFSDLIPLGAKQQVLTNCS